MSISRDKSSVMYAGNGVATEFPFDFKVWEPSHILVTQADEQGEETNVTAQVSVSVTETGGTVSLPSPLPVGCRLHIRRAMPFVQEDRYVTGTRFDPHEIEDALDIACAERQELREQLSRAVKMAVTDARTPEEYMAAFWKAVADVLKSVGIVVDAEDYIKRYVAGIPIIKKSLAEVESGADGYYWVTGFGNAGKPGHDISNRLVTADGSTKPRTLGERFADIVNVKDFGAKGDGVTDDTEAFEKAAKAGVVFVPDGNYHLTRNVAGRFFTIGDAVCDYIDLVRLYQKTPDAFAVNYVPLDIGETQDELQKTERAIQGPFVDPYDNVLYYTKTKTTGENRITAVRWSDDPAKRTVLGRSEYELNLVSHADHHLWRPSAADEPLIFCGGIQYSAPGVKDFSHTFERRLVRWDYKTNNYQVIRTFKLFDGSNLDASFGMKTCLSYDNRFVIAYVKDLSGRQFFRVWSAPHVFHGNVDDISASFSYEFDSPVTSSSGQGIYSDGKYIYLLSGSEQVYLDVITVGGLACFRRPVAKLGRDAYADDYTVKSEPEGIFWASYNGSIETMLAVSLAVYDQGNETSWTRRDRFLALSVPSSEYLEGSFSAHNSADNLDTLTEPGWYYYDGSATGAPDSGSGYVRVIRHINDTWTTVQVAYSRTSSSNVFIRNKTSDSWNSWYAVTKSTTDGVVDVVNNARIPGSSSGNSSLIMKMRSYPERLKTDRYAYISRYRNNDVSDDDSSSVQNHVRVGFVESGQAGGAFQFTAYQKGSKVSEAFYTFTESGKASLGNASYLWSQLFSSTGSINTSDEREKQDVAEYPDAVLDAWGKVTFRQFLFRDAVEKKGEAARIHAGVIAQQVVEAFEKHGLDATRYGLLCYDKWEDEYETVEVEDAPAALDSEGNETPAKTHTEKRLVTAAGDRYGIRYSEALCLEAAYQRRRVERMEQRLADIEAILNLRG